MVEPLEPGSTWLTGQGSAAITTLGLGPCSLTLTSSSRVQTEFVHFAGGSHRRKMVSAGEKKSLRQPIVATTLKCLDELMCMGWHLKVAVILMATMGAFHAISRQPLPAFCQNPVLNTEELNNIQAKYIVVIVDCSNVTF